MSGKQKNFVPKVRITSPHVAEAPPKRWSNAIHAGDFLYISGQVSRAKDGVTIEGKGNTDRRRSSSLRSSISSKPRGARWRTW